MLISFLVCLTRFYPCDIFLLPFLKTEFYMVSAQGSVKLPKTLLLQPLECSKLQCEHRACCSSLTKRRWFCLCPVCGQGLSFHFLLMSAVAETYVFHTF